MKTLQQPKQVVESLHKQTLKNINNKLEALESGGSLKVSGKIKKLAKRVVADQNKTRKQLGDEEWVEKIATEFVNCVEHFDVIASSPSYENK